MVLFLFFPIRVGTPQGTLLGPIMWLFYGDDLVADSPSVKMIKYANDTTLYTAIKKMSQITIDRKKDKQSVQALNNDRLC